MEVNGTLYDWRIVQNASGLYITGTIYGDTKGRFRDCTYINTSQVVELYTPIDSNEDWYCKTLNSTYKLNKNNGL